MTREDKIAIKSQRYKTYSTEHVSLDHSEDIENQENGEELQMKTKIGFGSGHVYNDIAANAGAGYALLFYTSVIGISNAHAGIIFMIGNIVDAIAVTTFGFLADLDFNCSIYRQYGKFKAWHLMGTIILTIGYPLTFLPPLGIENEVLKTVYYTGIFVFSNLGYAITAIAHNSIILKLATCESNQVSLSSIKTSGTAIACTLIYVVAYFCFGNEETKNLDTKAFTEFALVTTGAGVIASVVFHWMVKETTPNQISNVPEGSSTSLIKLGDIPKSIRNSISLMTKVEWLRDAKFYIIIMQFAISRTFYTVGMAYLVFYVQYTLMLDKEYSATVPLVMVLSGLLLSKPIKKIIDLNGLEKSLIFFCILGGATCIWVWFGLKSDESKRYEVFGLSSLLGISSYSMMVVSLSLVVALIGKNLGMCLCFDMLISKKESTC